MADIDFQGGFFEFNDGAALRDLSAQVLSIRGLPGVTDLREVTAMSDTTGRRFGYGLQNTQFTGEFKMTDGANDAWAVLRAARVAKATRAWSRGPAGNAATKVKLSGNALVVSVVETGRVNEIATFEATFQVDNGVTEGTY